MQERRQNQTSKRGRAARGGALALVLASAWACTGGPRPSVPRRFPPRASDCDLTIVAAAAPPVPAWEDLGVAETLCHVTVSRSECLMRFHATACSMGGDLVYAMPKDPLRPAYQATLLRGRVAHRRPSSLVPPGPTASAPPATPPAPPPVSPPTAATVSPTDGSAAASPTPDAATAP